MIIGFGNGDFHRLYENEHDRFSDEAKDCFLSAGANLIELMVHNEQMLDHLISLDAKMYAEFAYRSMHAPSHAYDEDEVSHRLMDKMIEVGRKFDIGHIVFHTDMVHSWDVITKCKDISVAIENMDDRKKFGQWVDDIRSILDRYPFGLVIDLQHCYANDQRMDLARDLHEDFSERIAGYHISGYHEALLHHPLFKTGQDEIIDHVERKDLPITIESSFDAYDEAKREFEYILDKL